MPRLPGGFDVALERGPDWLFVRLTPSANGRASGGHRLGASLLELARDHGTRRVVVELDGLQEIDDELLEGLALLGRILESEQGVLRLCGGNHEHLARRESCGATGHLPHFSCRNEAVGAGSWEHAIPLRPR